LCNSQLRIKVVALFESWRDASPAERSLALLRFADAIEARADDLVQAESRITGKQVAMTCRCTGSRITPGSST